jgi:hypothetical protein
LTTEGRKRGVKKGREERKDGRRDGGRKGRRKQIKKKRHSATFINHFSEHTLFPAPSCLYLTLVLGLLNLLISASKPNSKSQKEKR